jgi:hypothetical protein
MSGTRMTTIATLLVMGGAVLNACDSPTAESTNNPPGPNVPAPQPNSVTGVALDTQGRPIANATVWIEPALTTGLVQTRTDAEGRYTSSNLLSLPYNAKAWVRRDYNGQQFCLRLGMQNPADYDAFTPSSGVVRNFRWQLTGVIEDLRDYDGYFGGEVRVMRESDFRNGKIEFTFTPTAPLIDGSTGTTFMRTFDTKKDALVYDIPVGEYRVAATLVEQNGTRTPVKFATGIFDEDLTDTGVLTFEPSGSCGNGNGIDRSFLYVHSVYPW